MINKLKNINNNILNIIMLFFLFIMVLISIVLKTTSIFLFLSIIPMVILVINTNIIFSLCILVLIGIIPFIFTSMDFALKALFVFFIPAFLTGINTRGLNLIDILSKKYKSNILDIVCKTLRDNRVVSIKKFLVNVMFFVFGYIFYYLSMKWFLNIDLVNIIQNNINSLIDFYKSKAGYNSYKTLEDSGIIEVITQTGTIISVFVFLKCVIMALISYYICIPITNAFYNKNLRYVDVDMIFLPGRPVVFLFITIVFLYIIGNIGIGLDTSIIINNFIFVMNILFFVQGISLFIYMFRYWSKIKSNINWFIILFVILFMGILPGISTMGMLDNLFDYRQRWNPEEK